MTGWLRRAGRAILMGIMWAVLWSPIGPIIGFIVDRDGRMDEPWIAVGVYPGFFCGVFFCIALAVAERGRRFDDLAFKRIVAWGALAGVITGSLPLVLGEPTGGSRSVALILLMLPLILGVASAITSAGTLMLAKRGDFNVVDPVEEASPRAER
jgi:hypothetical protein